MTLCTALIALFLAVSTTLSAQFVTIPDANFRTWLNQNYPACMSGSQLDTTCSDILFVFDVDVGSKNINDLWGIQFFDALNSLDCSFNNLNALPPLPPNLSRLQCLGNNITTISTLPSSLTWLDCSSNGMTSFPPLTPGMITLIVGPNNIPLSSFPTLPNTLLVLSLRGMNLSALPTLPNSLKRVTLSNNPIGALPNPLPPNLESLNCYNCGLSNLVAVPPLMENLSLSNNSLTSLPNLPSSLDRLYMPSNDLTSLPALPLGMTTLNVEDNDLTCLPELPGTITSVNVDNNPLTCLPNYLPNMSAAALALPLCLPNDPVNNPNNCASAQGIVGLAYQDFTANCVPDAFDPKVKNLPLNIYDSGNNLIGTVVTASNGVYQYSTGPGTYRLEIDTANTPLAPSCPNPGIDSTVVLPTSNPFATGVDFEVACKPGFDVGARSVVPVGWVFPGQTHTLKVGAGDMADFYGLFCASSTSGMVDITVSGPVSYAGPAAGALTPNVSGNIYSYPVSAFGSINFDTDFALDFTTNTTAQSGDSVCVTVNVTPVSGDNNPSNNTFTYCYEVVNSYDPNDKQVYPQQVAPGYDDWLVYTIRFQNTGTAPAFNIEILDTLDANLDWHTFQALDYSHLNLVNLAGNQLSLEFPNIMLPDSASDPDGSTGYFQFRIKPISGLPDGTVIGNRVGIYFDFNPPVITNTATTVFGTPPTSRPEGSELAGLQVFPNPSQGLFHLQWEGERPAKRLELSVCNAFGQVLLARELKLGQDQTLDLSAYPAGMYFLRIVGAGVNHLEKLVVRH